MQTPARLRSAVGPFDAAIAQTSPGGEVIVLDSAGYGTVVIAKSVKIIAGPGIYAGISVFSSQNGVTVNAAPTDVVVLRGLTINAQGSGTTGILVNSGGAVQVESCVVDGMAVGVHLFAATSAVKLAVADTTISNGGEGIWAIAGASGSTSTLTVSRSTIEHHASFGLEIVDLAQTSISDSVIADTGDTAIITSTTANSSATTLMDISRSTVAGDRSTRGIHRLSSPVGAVILVSSSTIMTPLIKTAIEAEGDAEIELYGSKIVGNTYPHNGGIIDTYFNNACSPPCFGTYKSPS